MLSNKPNYRKDAIAFYSAQIMELDSVFEDTRSVDKTKQLALNSTLTVGISMFLLSLFFCSLCVWTPADVPSLLFRHVNTVRIIVCFVMNCFSETQSNCLSFCSYFVVLLYAVLCTSCADIVSLYFKTME